MWGYSRTFRIIAGDRPHKRQMRREVADTTSLPTSQLAPLRRGLFHRGTMKASVEMMNRAEAVAVLTDGTQIPIVQWLDEEVDDCEYIDSPVCAIAGPDKDGMWHTLVLEEFHEMQTH